MITAALFVVAAALGALVRLELRPLSRSFSLPLGTLAVNWAGAFALGIVVGWDQPAVTVVGVGFLGTMTTFAALSGELATLPRNSAVNYAMLTLVGGVGLAYLGLQL